SSWSASPPSPRWAPTPTPPSPRPATRSIRAALPAEPPAAVNPAGIRRAGLRRFCRQYPRPKSAPFVPCLRGPLREARGQVTVGLVEGARPRRPPGRGLTQRPRPTDPAGRPNSELGGGQTPSHGLCQVPASAEPKRILSHRGVDRGHADDLTKGTYSQDHLE